jgi:hypothetical protein
MLLSPSEMGVAPSSHFLEMKSLNNSTRPDHFSSMTPSPLPPPPYKKRQEPHNLPPHPLSSFLWFSLVQAPTLTGAQVVVATTPRRMTAFVAPPS